MVTRRVDAIMSVISRCVGLVAVTVQLSNRGVAGQDGRAISNSASVWAACVARLVLLLRCVSLLRAGSAISHVTLVFCSCEGRVVASMFPESRTR